MKPDSGIFFEFGNVLRYMENLANNYFFTYTMKRLIKLYVRKPFLLDLTIALFLIPLFCHFIVALHTQKTLTELIAMRGYRIAMAMSYCCGLVAMLYIRCVNRWLDKRYGIDDHWEQRALMQLKWNVLPPLIFIVAIVSVYFAYHGESIFSRGYLRRDIFWVGAAVVMLVMTYYLQSEHRYFLKKQQELYEYNRLNSQTAVHELPSAENPAATPAIIKVVLPERRREGLCISLDDVAVVDRHNNRTTVSTWDGRRFEWPMPSRQMKELVTQHGFTWLGQHYALVHAAVEANEGVGEKGRRLLLKCGIEVNDAKQVFRQKRNGQERTFIIFHKNIAREVGEWYENGVMNKKRPPRHRDGLNG